jgi:hypothetical protein
MDKVGDKFSLYDFIGYLFPGLTLIFTIQLLLGSFNINLTEISPIGKGSGEKILFYTIAGYIVGHFIQAIGNWFEERENSKKYDGAKYYSKYLVEKCKDKEYVSKFLERASSYFEISESGNEQTLFRYAYKYLLVNNIGGEYKTFNFFYSFYRGMVVSFVFGGILSSAILIIIIIDFFFKFLDIFNLKNVIIFTSVILAQRMFYTNFKKRFFRFGEYFTNEVITCFNIQFIKNIL